MNFHFSVNYPFNTKLDTELVAKVASSMLAKNAEAPKFMVSEFNSCRLKGVLPSFNQYVSLQHRKLELQLGHPEK